MLKLEFFRTLEIKGIDQEILDKIAQGKGQWEKQVQVRLEQKDLGWRLADNKSFCMFEDWIYVPMNKKLREKILNLHHDRPIEGHPGRDKMFELITRTYYWPGL